MKRRRRGQMTLLVVLLLTAAVVTLYCSQGNSWDGIEFLGESENITIPDALYRRDEVTDLTIPKRPVIIMGFSSNHFDEAQGLFQSIDRYLPQHRVVVYDLGLTHHQRDTLARYCRCELRRLDWSRYPAHLRWLASCAFKPAIINETLTEFGFVFWVDSSVRFTTNDTDSAYQRAHKYGFVTVQDYAVTRCYIDPRSLLALNVSNPHLYEHTRTIQAGTVMFVRRNDVVQHLLDPWVRCALDRDCIQPRGASHYHCHSDRSPKYCGCHRFDQATLEVLMYRFFGGPFDFDAGKGSTAPYSLPPDQGILTVRREEYVRYFKED